MANVIKHMQVIPRIDAPDMIFSWQSRDADTDAMYQWDGDSWVLMVELDGTDLIYDSAFMQDELYWCDGKNPVMVLHIGPNTVCALSDVGIAAGSLVFQYLLIYQNRLIGAGDARSQAEVEADSQVWPADSNRQRVRFSEALDTTVWPPNNFINVDVGNGESVSGLGVNSINSATSGAQTQLVVFTPTSTSVNDGTLAAADQKLAVTSTVLGCPGYHSIRNTPFGLMWCARNTVCMLDTSGKEPSQMGFAIAPAIAECPVDLQQWTAAIFHENCYKLAIGDVDATTKNNSEWWLDMRPQIFPQEQNWYGPHSGDYILQYGLPDQTIIGAEMLDDNLWQLDVEGQYDSMTTTDPRTSTMTWPRFKVDNIKKGKVDAYGFRGETDASTDIQFVETIHYDTNTATMATASVNITTTVPIYNVVRPIRRTSYDAQVSIDFSENADLEIHSVYLRSKFLRRQSEPQSGFSQTLT